MAGQAQAQAPGLAPIQARPGFVLPEPSSAVLLGLGVLGLIIGRRAARKD